MEILLSKTGDGMDKNHIGYQEPLFGDEVEQLPLDKIIEQRCTKCGNRKGDGKRRRRKSGGYRRSPSPNFNQDYDDYYQKDHKKN